MMRTWVDDAVSQGARQEAVCNHLGVSERSLQRWVTTPEDARQGPRSPDRKSVV